MRSARPSPTSRPRTSPTASACCPPPKRRAMSAVYALARRIDDIGDGDDCPPTAQAGRSSRRRAQGARRGDAGTGDDPVLVALADARPPLPAPDGRVRRADRRLRAWTSTGTDLRDRRRPGRLLPPGGRFGRAAVARRVRHRRPRESAEPLAEDLGVALQLTNILRDVVEDRGDGPRLPARRGRSTGSAARPIRPARGTRWPLLVALRGARARTWFAAGLAAAPLLDRRSRACMAAMAGIYRRLLGRIERRPGAGAASGRRVAADAGEGAGWRRGSDRVGAGVSGAAWSSSAAAWPGIGRRAGRWPTPGPTVDARSSAGPASAGRRGRSGATACGSTTASTCSSAAAPPTAPSSTASAPPSCSTSRTASTCPCWHRAAARPAWRRSPLPAPAAPRPALAAVPAPPSRRAARRRARRAGAAPPRPRRPRARRR